MWIIWEIKEKKMNAIIKALKKYPYRDIYQVARLLKIEPLEVSNAQHEYLKKFRKKSK